MLNLCREANCHLSQVRKVAARVLKQLDREAFCSETRTTGMLLQCHFLLGPEACYHMGGVLEECRIDHNPAGVPWSATLLRLDAGMDRHAVELPHGHEQPSGRAFDVWNRLPIESPCKAPGVGVAHSDQGVADNQGVKVGSRARWATVGRRRWESDG